MIIATFNVNGVRARAQHILDWLDQRRPDIVCLQEIKCQNNDFPTTAFEAAGYHSLVRGQKAYNGVAILSRRPPDETTAEFGDGGDESEARLITARWGGLWVINTYVPQGRDITDPAFQAKLEFLGRVRNLIADRFQNHDLVLWTGDINAALSDLDVYHPEKHWGKVEYNQQEIDAVNAVLNLGYSDLFRTLHPDRIQYTFWDYRLPNGYKRNLGWRIDHLIASAALTSLAKACEVDQEPREKAKPSDHTPIWAEFDL